MTVTKLEKVECDRCGREQSFGEDDPARTDWSAWLAKAAGKHILGDAGEPADLCPACTDLLMQVFDDRELVALLETPPAAVRGQAEG